MTNGSGDDDFSLHPEDIDILKQMFGITSKEDHLRFDKVIQELKDEYGFVDKQMLVQKLMKEFGIDGEFFNQIQKDMADLTLDHVDHLFQSSLQFDIKCNVCGEPYTELCDHLDPDQRLETMLQLGRVDNGLDYLQDKKFPKLEEIIWKIRFLIIDHQISKIKQLLDEASQLIYDDDDIYNIFRVQVLKIHYLLDQRQYDEALKVADTISPFAEQLEDDENTSLSYWMASLSQGMASALLKMGQVEVALDPLIVSTELFIEIKNQYQVAVSFSLISSVMGILQEGKKVEEAARIALRLMNQLDNEFGLIRVKTFVSSGFLALFETEISLDYATEALELALKFEKKTLIAALYGLMAQIYLVANQYNNALEVAEKCYEYASQQEINEIRAIAISLKGDIHAEQAKIDQAIDFYEEAISMLEDGKDDQIILDLDRRIAELEQLR